MLIPVAELLLRLRIVTRLELHSRNDRTNQRGRSNYGGLDGLPIEAGVGSDPAVPGVSQGLRVDSQDTDTNIVIGFCGKLRFPTFSP